MYQTVNEHIDGLTLDTIQQWHFTAREGTNVAFIDTCLEDGTDLDEIVTPETYYTCIAIMTTEVIKLFSKIW